ncbi:hypothetical protein ACTFIZ_004123 [Dictyostelium cf. discoideum]
MKYLIDYSNLRDVMLSYEEGGSKLKTSLSLLVDRFRKKNDFSEASHQDPIEFIEFLVVIIEKHHSITNREDEFDKNFLDDLIKQTKDKSEEIEKEIKRLESDPNIKGEIESIKETNKIKNKEEINKNYNLSHEENQKESIKNLKRELMNTLNYLILIHQFYKKFHSL